MRVPSLSLQWFILWGVASLLSVSASLAHSANSIDSNFDNPDYGFVGVGLRLDQTHLESRWIKSPDNRFLPLRLAKLGFNDEVIATIPLRPTVEDFHGEVLYLGRVPAGRYRLKGVMALVNQHPIGLAFDQDIGTFQVLPNTITALDTLVVHSIPGGSWPSLSLTRVESGLPFEQILSSHADLIKDGPEDLPVIAWDERKPGLSSQAVASSLREYPKPSGQFIVDSLGRVLQPSTTGSIRIRMPDGRWNYAESGRSVTLRSVQEDEEGYLIAGAFGTLFQTRSLLEADWAVIEGLPTTADILFATRDQDGRYIVLARNYEIEAGHWGPIGGVRHRVQESLSIYQREASSGGEWEQMKQFVLDVHLRNPMVSQVGSGVIVSASSFRSDKAFMVDFLGHHIEEIFSKGGILDRYWIAIDKTSFVRYEVYPEDKGHNLRLYRLKGPDDMEIEGSERLRQVEPVAPPARLEDGRLLVVGRKRVPHAGGRSGSGEFIAPQNGLGEDYEDGDPVFITGRPGQNDWIPHSPLPKACLSPMKPIVISVDELIQPCAHGLVYRVDLEGGDHKLEGFPRVESVQEYLD